MFHEAKRRQRRADIACGYALGAYLGVVLCWVSIQAFAGFLLFALLITASAGFFGLIRAIGLPARLWWVQLGSLVYLLALMICSYYSAILVAVYLGIAFTTVFALPIVKLFKNDFAKTIPPWLCSECGYPLLGLTEPICPECGRPVDLSQVPDVSAAPVDEG